jgi:hypothetical protein
MPTRVSTRPYIFPYGLVGHHGRIRRARASLSARSVLDTFQITPQLLLEHRKIILGELGVELSAQLKHAAKS